MILDQPNGQEIASIMEEASALFFPAMSKAVPCAGEVRTNGRPIVRLTNFRKYKVLTGISPWSWYMANRRQNVWNCADKRSCRPRKVLRP